jgi:hypothetical protein
MLGSPSGGQVSRAGGLSGRRARTTADPVPTWELATDSDKRARSGRVSGPETISGRSGRRRTIPGRTQFRCLRHNIRSHSCVGVDPMRAPNPPASSFLDTDGPMRNRIRRGANSGSMLIGCKLAEWRCVHHPRPQAPMRIEGSSNRSLPRPIPCSSPWPADAGGSSLR